MVMFTITDSYQATAKWIADALCFLWWLSFLLAYLFYSEFLNAAVVIKRHCDTLRQRLLNIWHNIKHHVIDTSIITQRA